MHCETCGNPLVRVLGEETITTIEGKTMVFRRDTDYLLCKTCLKLYSIVSLRESRGIDVSSEATEAPEVVDSPRAQDVNGDVTDLNYFSVLEADLEEGDSVETSPLPRRRSKD